MVTQKQNQHTGTPTTGRNPLEQGSDDQAKHLVESARKLQEEAAEMTKAALDPRRSMPIDVQKGSSRAYLYINGTLWVEIDWSQERQAFCIQDCFGYCLSHVAHIVSTIPYGGGPLTASGLVDGMNNAIKVAEQMIRDGRMRTPEEAKEFAIKNNTSARKHYGF